MHIDELCRALDRHPRRIPLPELQAALRELVIRLEDVSRWVLFDPNGYRRNLMHAGTSYQALVLCWRSGQRSPIHDHRGSSCGVRVLKGTALETVFARTPSGMVYATHSREHPAGSVCASQDADIHQVSNLSDDGSDLVTLHVYSPPLLSMGTYTLFDPVVREFVDPVHAEVLVDGGGI
jgi:cysteine dioxygenase